MRDNIIVVSDLHLGAPHSLLANKQTQKRFVDAIKSIENITSFVLLGDILDLTMSQNADVWNLASIFFKQLFTGLKGNPQIYYIPGNHDHHIWTLLIEQEGIIAPLHKIISYPASGNHSLEALKLQIDSFPPDSCNFVQALFPEESRNRVWIKYPFFRTSANGKPLFFHHGHYFDRKITPFAMKVAKKHKTDAGIISKIEEANFAWIEGLFYFASLGRMSREFLSRTYQRYEKILKYQRKVIRGTLFDWVSWFDEKIGGIPIERIKKLMKYIYNEPSYILVFGHTHKEDSHPDRSISMYNTGGWLIENKNGKGEVKPVILQIKDSQIIPIEFEIKED